MGSQDLIGGRSAQRCRWQVGQPDPMARLRIFAAQECPAGHCHHTTREARGVTCCEVNSPLAVGCHCAANAGETTARLWSADGRRPAQYGQFWPMLRLPMVACHSWFRWQCHHTLRDERAVTCSGVRAPLAVGATAPRGPGAPPAGWCSRLRAGAGSTGIGYRPPGRRPAPPIGARSGKSHQMDRFDPWVTCSGPIPTLRSGSHCRASSGWVWVRSSSAR